MNVADLKRGELDDSGDKILQFYARQPPDYAVYQTGQRVSVQYADDTIKADAQRKALTQLAPMRGELDGLLQSWRDAKESGGIAWPLSLRDGGKLHDRANRYDRRIADALRVALEGDLTGAGQVFSEIKADVLDERTGWARLEYLLASLGFAMLFILLAAFIAQSVLKTACFDGLTPLCFSKASDLWRGAMAGAFGAFFSIAIGIRGRTVLPDLNREANLTDAGLRVAIGIIAGTVIVALIVSGFVVLAIGQSQVKGEVDSLYMAIAGFLAGFSERMVPDLLASAVAKTGEAPVVRAPILTPAPVVPDKGAPADGTKPAVAGAPNADPAPDQTAVDCCVSGVDLTDQELTRDEDLPVASGGVNVSAQGGV
jgi:hypothetical protein